tara:strand:+ start:268 stop:900 length:633 start_codon:yes stop_codon:yes gene_type:complete
MVPGIDPRKLKVMKLEEKKTLKSDNKTTKKKKMTNHLIQKLHDEIKNTGSFLRTMVDVNANKKPNGCINYSDISANVMGGMLQNFNSEEIKNSINNSLNSFQNEYNYLLNDYYKISNTQIYQDKKDYGVIESVQSNNIMDYYLYEPLYVLKQYKNNFDSDQLELYKSEAIKQSVLDELNKLDLDKFPKKIMDLVQNMGQKQCDKDKKCCV